MPFRILRRLRNQQPCNILFIVAYIIVLTVIGVGTTDLYLCCLRLCFSLFFFLGVKAIGKTGPTKCFPWYNDAMSRVNLSSLIASGRLDLQNWIPVMPNADSVPRFCGSSMTRRSSTRISTWLPLRRLTENRTTAQKDIRESCDEVHQSIKESRDAILEAQASRRPPPPPPSILLNGPKKFCKRAGDHDVRVTSALHRRKPLWQGSIESVKTFTQRCGSKGREVFRSATKSAHPRSASVSHRKKSSLQASTDTAKVVTQRMCGKSKEAIGVVAEEATHRSTFFSINTDISSIHTATVGPQSSLGKIESALRSTSLSVLSVSGRYPSS